MFINNHYFTGFNQVINGVNHLQSLHLLVQDYFIADIGKVRGTLDIVFGEIDRELIRLIV